MAEGIVLGSSRNRDGIDRERRAAPLPCLDIGFWCMIFGSVQVEATPTRADRDPIRIDRVSGSR